MMIIVTESKEDGPTVGTGCKHNTVSDSEINEVASKWINLVRMSDLRPTIADVSRCTRLGHIEGEICFNSARAIGETVYFVVKCGNDPVTAIFNHLNNLIYLLTKPCRASDDSIRIDFASSECSRPGKFSAKHKLYAPDIAYNTINAMFLYNLTV